MKSAAPMSRTTARPISPAVNSPPNRRWLRPLPRLLSPSARRRLRSTRDEIRAGTRPNASTAVMAMAVVNARTVASIGTPWPVRPIRVIVGPVSATTASIATRPMMNPTAPPDTASRTLSVMSCCTIRRRVAPSAARIAISGLRAAPRASSRLARFAHAISSTRQTAPERTSNGSRSWRVRIVWSGSTVAPSPWRTYAGYRRRSSPAAAATRDCASASDTDGRRRPATTNRVSRVVLAGSICSGTHTSGSANSALVSVAVSNPGWRIPTMTCGRPSSRSVCPMALPR